MSDWLLYYPDYIAEHTELQDIALYPGQAVSDEIRGQGETSDRTGKAAVRLADSKHDARWFAVIEEVERRIPEKQRVFLEIRREVRFNHSNHRGRPAWVPYVQCKYPLVMAERTGRGAEDYYIGHPNTFTLWWNRLVEYTARLATKKGLFEKGE